MESEWLINRLINEYQYSPKGALVVAEKIAGAQPIIKQSFFEFLDSHEIPEIEVEGYTIKRLIDQHDMKPPAAFLTLDWLMRSPDEAKKSLTKGHDWIGKKPR